MAAMTHRWAGLLTGALLLVATPALAQNQNCAPVTQAHADASAGTPNVSHDGSPLPGIPAPDISRGFQGIPRSAQPRLTASQQRILECTYRLAEADADTSAIRAHIERWWGEAVVVEFVAVSDLKLQGWRAKFRHLVPTQTVDSSASPLQ